VGIEEKRISVSSFSKLLELRKSFKNKLKYKATKIDLVTDWLNKPSLSDWYALAKS
jgi:hypothetical protein